MIMKKAIYLFLVIILTLSLFNCRKEPGYIGAPDPDPVPIIVTPEPITANLQGNIVDENNLPAEGVSITVGNKTASTDAKGFFKIAAALLDRKNSLVQATKTGYFKGLRHFAATSGTNYVKIKLIPRTLAGSIDAATGGTATLSNGSIVRLPANGIKDAATGNSYSGLVKVFAQYIDPTAADLAITIPGSLSAIDKDGKQVVLTSFGMMAVELESAAGEKLQIKTGNKATLTMPIPAAALASAPASIPLWFVDETNGLWREEGSATKQGNQYIGEVSHFSFWNCDFSSSGITLTMRLININQTPLVNTAVKLTRPGISWLNNITGYTDSLGQVSGLVPTNEALVMEVLDPCGTTLYTQNINPMTQDTDLGNITVTNTGSGIITLEGRLINCNNIPVTNGYAMISFDNNTRYAAVDGNGRYQTSFTFCAGSGSVASILAVDNGTGGGPQHSTTVNVNLTSPATNLADIVVCDTTPFAYINYNIDGVDYYWNASNSFQMQGVDFPGSFTLLVDNQPGPRQFVLNVDGSSTGVFGASFTSTDAFPSGGSVSFIPGFTSTVTRFATSWPDFFEGSFTGQYTHSSTGSTVHTINGTYRVMHQF